MKPKIEPTKGMNETRPERQADEEPEVQADEAEGDAIEEAQEQAHRRLPAHEPGDRAVDLAGEHADRLGMVAGQPAVDLGDHAVPVEQHVEGDDGGDHQQADDAEQRPACPSTARRAPLRHRRRPAPPRRTSVRSMSGSRLPTRRPNQPCPISAMILLIDGDEGRSAFAQQCELVAEHREEEQHSDDEDDRKARRMTLVAAQRGRPRRSSLSAIGSRK